MKKLILLSLVLLASCNGPWNMMADDYGPGTPKLWVSSFAVADLPFDTLWLERPQSLTEAYDSSKVFVDTNATTILAIREDFPDTVRFRPAPKSGVAWLPVEKTVVARGGTYRLQAVVTWKTATGDTRRDSLSATTHVPKIYSIYPWGLAPIEALAPWTGKYDSVSKATPADKAKLEKLQVTDATLDSIRQNLSVYRPVHKEDTVWFIHDETKIVDITGATLQRFYRNYVFAQEIRRSDWAGLLATETFDTTGDYILSPLRKQFQSSSGRDKVDSTRLYQRGNLRSVMFEAAYDPGKSLSSVAGKILDTLQKATGSEIQPWVFSNAFIGYTGRLVLRVYALDPNHYEYYSRLANAGSNNNLRWSGIRNGDGYFSSAIVDSFPLFVRATQDTFSVKALHSVWCLDRRDKARKDGTTIDTSATSVCPPSYYKTLDSLSKPK